jgi:protein-S-isoprenylcysteine O-methyltransferase Ste14
VKPASPLRSGGSRLDLKIPPVAVFLLAAALAWALAKLLPGLDFEIPAAHYLAGAVAMAGAAFGVAGIAAFRRHDTTVDPRSPDEATTIVSSGIYRYTRNPMYVGLALLLAAGTIALENLAAFVAVPLFVGYLTAYQIRPEERLLFEKFGTPYADYAMKVRRWL